MSKTPTLASVNGSTLSGAQQKTYNTGLLAAMKTAGMQEGSRTTVTADATLTVSQCGLLLVDCTGGNVALTLPTSGSTTDDAVYLVRRFDSTTNTLTLTRGGADTVEGAATAVSVAAQGVLGLQMPAGGTDWKVLSRNGGTQAGARAAIGLGAGADIASAATLDLTSRTGNIVRVTGATSITAITMNNGDMVLVEAVGALPFNVSGLLVYTCTAGDSVLLWQDGDGTQGASVLNAGSQPPTVVTQAKGGTGTSLATRQVAQVAVSRTSAVATGTTTIPLDNTIPQQTEGDQYLSLTITPKSASSLLEFDVQMNIAHSASSGMIAALFQDSGANAIAVATGLVGTGLGRITLRHTMPAGTTSATTFKVRAGSNGAGTTTVNGNGGVQTFGGVADTSITIKEYLP